MHSKEAQYAMAINAMLADVGINFRVERPEAAQYEIKIPEPLKCGGLFTALGIDVEPVLNRDKSVKNIQVRWWYRHPNSGRSYCLIGVVGWDLADCAWWGNRVQNREDGSDRQGWIHPVTLANLPAPPKSSPCPEAVRDSIAQSLRTNSAAALTLDSDEALDALIELADDYSHRGDGTLDVWGTTAVGNEWWLNVTLSA